MKLTDYLCMQLSRIGVKNVFGVTGGSAVHLLESAEKRSDLRVIYTHHEQSASFAATASSRLNSSLGACFVTTGPGGTNAVTGLASAWLDSVPAVFVSGQARSGDSKNLRRVRQVGSQHFDIIKIVESLCKFSFRVENDPNDIVDALILAEEALLTGRPGPIWLDIALDLQWSDVDPSLYLNRKKDFKKSVVNDRGDSKSEELISELALKIRDSKRPLFIIGYGVRLAGRSEELKALCLKKRIPFVTTWNTIDFCSYAEPQNCGLLGISGTREANLITNSSDLIVVFGSHLCKQLTGDDLSRFAPNSEIYVIDIDESEFYHLETSRIKTICYDLGKLSISDLELKLPNASQDWVKKYTQLKSYRDYGIDNEMSLFIDEVNINQYRVYRIISEKLKDNDIIVVDGGGNVLFSALQNIKVKGSNRLITGSGIGCMGSGLPEAIGAAASSESRVICFIGDGSMQFNIQELETIRHNNLNIVVVIFNNDGYLAIKNTQDAYFNNRFGVDAASGLSLPDYAKVVTAYDIRYEAFKTADDLEKFSSIFADSVGPLVMEVFVPENTPLIPRGGFRENVDGTRVRREIWDMYPDLNINEE